MCLRTESAIMLANLIDVPLRRHQPQRNGVSQSATGSEMDESGAPQNLRRLAHNGLEDRLREPSKVRRLHLVLCGTQNKRKTFTQEHTHPCTPMTTAFLTPPAPLRTARSFSPITSHVRGNL